MKGHLLALLTACSLAVTLVITSPVIALAADEDIEKTGGLADDGSGNQEAYVRDENGVAQFGGVIAEKDIDVQAKIVGSSDKIIYSIKLSYGKMQFVYDFGQTWDPENHAYLPADSGESTGGWVKSYLDGTNNAIYIQNDSNYPVQVDFSYSPKRTGTATSFNSKWNNTGSVIGIFYDESKASTVRSDINKSAYNGYGASSAKDMTSTSIRLDMDYSNLTAGVDADFGVLADGTDYSTTIYFALCGKPDSTATVSSDFASVGTIKLKITPVPKSDTNTIP